LQTLIVYLAQPRLHTQSLVIKHLRAEVSYKYLCDASHNIIYL